MRDYNPTKPVNEWNYAIEAEYGWNGENLIRSAFFGTAKEFAEWLDRFDYGSGDVFGWNGDSAVIEAVDSFRKEPAYALPEFITEYDVNNETDSGRVIGADEFNRLFRTFHRKDGFRVRRWAVPDGHVYAVMHGGELSGALWHVPTDADCVWS